MEGKLNQDEEISLVEFIAKQSSALQEILREISTRDEELERMFSGLQELVDSSMMSPGGQMRIGEKINKIQSTVQDLRESCFSFEDCLTKPKVAKLNVTQRERMASDIARLLMRNKQATRNTQEAVSLMKAYSKKE